MLMNRHRAPRQRMTERRLIDLPVPTPDSHRIVLGHYPLRLHREDPVQVAPAGLPKCCPLLRCRRLELLVESRNILRT
jgi:hypothetical protein